MKKKIIKILKKSTLVLPALIFLTAYSAIPERITLNEGEAPDFKWSIMSACNVPGGDKYSLDVKLFNLIPVKTVDVSVMPKTYLIPSGEAVGVKLFTDGVLVVGIGDVKDENGKVFYPARDAGILVGDRILSVNGKTLEDTDDFTDAVNEADGEAVLLVARENKRLKVKLNAICSGETGNYKVGLWVRDSTAGIGTLTFYNPENGTFGALGHGICDSDTKDLMVVKKGSINECRIRSVIKGENGIAGELSGEFSGNEIGRITENTEEGIAGTAVLEPTGEPIPAATRTEVTKGPAKILCDVDESGPQSYRIEITKVSQRKGGKNLVLKVSDERLIQKTGGIVQGMSGSPIIQNGKIVGAVTHVFVNDPTRGYGIFIEEMLK